MEKQLVTRLHQNFEDCAHEQDGVEFWYARELQELLGYNNWQNFENIVRKAKTACKTAGQEIDDHFIDVSKMVDIGSSGQREIQDFKLTRYACYLIAQNGDPRKEAIAFAMTYFAVQTRKQELIEERLEQWERLQAREKLSISEKSLSGILFERGIDGKGFGVIRSKGDNALFGGYTTHEMKDRLGVPEGRALADFLPSVTIKAKDLANEITAYKVKNDPSLHGTEPIADEHVENNKNVRATLTKSGIFPEDLPADEDIKKLERKIDSEGKKIPKVAKKFRGH